MSVYHNKSWSPVERRVNQVKKFNPFCILGTCNGSFTMMETPADGFDFNEEPVNLETCINLFKAAPVFSLMASDRPSPTPTMVISRTLTVRSSTKWSSEVAKYVDLVPPDRLTHLMWCACVSLTLQQKSATAARCERPCWCSVQRRKAFFLCHQEVLTMRKPDRKWHIFVKIFGLCPKLLISSRTTYFTFIVVCNKLLSQIFIFVSFVPFLLLAFWSITLHLLKIQQCKI